MKTKLIVLYDQLWFRRIATRTDKSRFEVAASEHDSKFWFLDPLRSKRLFDCIWIGLMIVAGCWAGIIVATEVHQTISISDVTTAVGLGLLTWSRVMVLIVVASLIWVSLGAWIGLRPAWARRIQPIAHFFAAFPVNTFFPLVVTGLFVWKFSADIWLSSLIILSTQWFILYNVISDASARPNDLQEAAYTLNSRSSQRLRDLIPPGIFPYYVTGALTASGGAMNASIVAEVVGWRNTHLQPQGLGSFIANAMSTGDFLLAALGIAIISVLVLLMNPPTWRPTYRLAEKILRLN